MVDQPKKTNYTMWILIGLGVLILALGICIYFMWRRISSLELDTSLKIKGLNDRYQELVVTASDLKNTVKSKENEISNLKDTVGLQRDNLTKINYKLKEAGIKVKKTPAPKDKEKDCKDGSCELDVEEL